MRPMNTPLKANYFGWFSERINSAFWHQWAQGPGCKAVQERLGLK